MTRNRILGVLLVSALGVLTSPAARAAQLQQVSGWTGGTTFPSDVSMYAYVPDKVATNPPILTLVHYCGGTASAVFGQASGGGIVKAADQYGFIMVVPSSARCWDVVSSATRKRDGGGDSHAIKQMVKFALDKYKANPDRVYSTGDSSGGMMTELLLAVYPDIFKAGSSFAGIPAGCGTATSSPGTYDGSCAGGTVAHTAQEWGDIVRKMDPDYTGHRPRIQLFHGDADGTISYKNMAESVTEYVNLQGLSADPTSTDSGLTLGTHQAKRQTWQNSCGYSVIEAFTSIGGDHGPSDALFVSQYVIPFLGLDKTGTVDPEIEKCGTGGVDGGAGGVGGAGGSGGSSGAKDGGVGGSAGTTGAGGSSSTGGSNSSGGSSGNGGASGTGGSQSSGGSATGGSQASGGAVSTGGKSSTGGSGSGGTSSNGGAAGNSTTSGGSSACSLVVGSTKANNHASIAMLALGLALTLARRRRGQQ
jgi:poly(hydroxyalkanoate) depolymerase family esterase